MSSCRLILDSPADGAWNMAVDELLLEQADQNRRPSLRFYSWREATVSLGYFQRHKDRAQHAASRDCPLVRRLSGGGAIVHDEELTYSLALPASHPLAARAEDLYRTVHGALVATLGQLGVPAEIRAAADQTGAEPFLCFQRRAAGDVLVGCEKIAGSAQRRRHGAVLQHGSVLLRASLAAPELPGLESLTRLTFSADELTDLWGARLREALGTRWICEPISPSERERAQAVGAEKYSADAWSRRR
jgi:lipoate-protein ligase A